MRAYIIDARTDRCEAIDVKPSLSEYHRLIGCECINIITRCIGDVPFNIVLDDEGKLKPNRVTAVANDYPESLVGTLLMFGVDDDLELRSLTDSETELVESRIVRAVFADGRIRPALFYTG